MNIVAFRQRQANRLAPRGWLKCLVNVAVLICIYITASLVFRPIDPLVATLTICMVFVVARFLLKDEDVRSEWNAGLAAAGAILGMIIFAATYNDPVVMLRLLSMGCIIVTGSDAYSLLKGRVGQQSDGLEEPKADRTHRMTYQTSHP